MNGGLRSGFILAAAVLAVALLCPEVPGRLSGQGSELLTNGGFEDPIGPPWYGGPNLRVERVSDPRYEGNYAARLTVTDGRVGELGQVVSPIPGPEPTSFRPGLGPAKTSPASTLSPSGTSRRMPPACLSRPISSRTRGLPAS